MVENHKRFTPIKTSLRKNLVSGFTLIELLVTISIIGLLVGISIIGATQLRSSSRDAKRKSDLETIRGALELYRSDCNTYPAQIVFEQELVGITITPDFCPVANSYMNAVPNDPLGDSSTYVYSTDGTSYELCAGLESTTTGNGCTILSAECGTNPCNYSASSP